MSSHDSPNIPRYFFCLCFAPVFAGGNSAIQPSQRYPDPLVRIIDPSFTKYRLPLAKVERIAAGMRWSEGPVWFGDGRYLLWSDIPNNSGILRPLTTGKPVMELFG